MTELTVVLAGGGSAGHVNPLLATASRLRDGGAAVTAVGTFGGMEERLVPEAGVELQLIEKVAFPRRPDLNMLRFPVRYRAAVKAAGEILDRARADVAVGFGGFASTPIYAAAKKRGIPVVIHEQNAKPGLANKYGVRFAAGVGLTFPSTPLRAKVGRTEVVGLPLRQSISDLAAARGDQGGARAARAAAASVLGLDPDMTTLVVTGGSLGAQHLNEVLVAARHLMKDVQVLHLTGRDKDAPVRDAVVGMHHYHVRDYMSDMENAYAVADMVVCRSGAGTVAELGALGIPALFVPLPIGNGEQELNAADVVKAGGAILFRNADFTVQVVESDLMPLLADPALLLQMGAAARSVSPADGALRFAEMIKTIGEETR